MRRPIITIAPWMWADGYGKREQRQKIILDINFCALTLSWGRLTWGIVLNVWPGKYRQAQIGAGKGRGATPGIWAEWWSIENAFPSWKREVRWPAAA